MPKNATWIGTGTRLGGVLLSASLVLGSFPPGTFEFLAWVCLVPLLAAIRGRSPGVSCLYCHLFGICYILGTFYWINVVGNFSPVYFLLFGLYFGIYFGLFGLLLNWISPVLRRPPFLIVPSLWVTMEYFRANAGFLALPWPLLGHSQHQVLSIIQIASVTGTYGVSFLIVTVNVAITEVLLRMASRESRRDLQSLLKPVVVALTCVGITLAFGRTVLSRETCSSGKIAVTVVQANIPQGRKWDPQYRDSVLAQHLRLSETALLDANPSLIVWPETAVPGALPTDQVLLRAYSGLARKAGSYLLVGNAPTPKLRFAAGRARIEKMYNSAFLFSPQGMITTQYNKIHLLPFGEYLPYRKDLPWPSRILKALETDFSPGDQYTIFSLDGVPFAVGICWENGFSELFRRFVKNGARFMVNITNEAWFGETAASYQFLAMSVFRAVENRVAVVRSGNSGISCFISPRGEIYGRVDVNGKDIFVEGHLTREVPLRDQTTFFTLHGDLFALGNVVMTFAGTLGFAVLKGSDSKTRDGQAA